MINPLDRLLEPPDRGRQIDLQWGYITSTAPLRLRNEHEAAPIPATPSKLVDVFVGDRVYYVHSGKRLVILGRAGGGSSGWQDWTPTLTATSTNPTMGNSERLGRYVVRGDGTVSFSAKITIGSTFSVGDGMYMLPLPVPANPDLEWHARLHVVGANLVSGIGESFGYGKIEDGATVTRMFVRSNTSTATNLLRVRDDLGWEAGNRLIIQGEYERA